MRDSRPCRHFPLHAIQAGPTNDVIKYALNYYVVYYPRSHARKYVPAGTARSPADSAPPPLGQACKIQTILSPLARPLYHSRI